MPGWRETPPGAAWWAAFGLDVDLRGVWVSRWSCAAGMSEAEATDAAELVLLEALVRQCNVPGLPREVVQ